MNFHVTTPTEAKAIARHRAFHQAIERKAAELQSSKLLCALRSQSRPAAIAPLQPEAIPAEPDPPALPALPISVCNRITIIQRLTCQIFGGITLAEIKYNRRTRDLCSARQVAMYLCKKYTPHSLPTVGRAFGGKDHTTVLHACRVVETILSMPAGSGLGAQRPSHHCDKVRERTEAIRAALLELVPEIGAEA